MENQEQITLENFSETNRSRVIGNSLYRICKSDVTSKDIWYIFEAYNNTRDWGMYKGYHSENLQAVIDILNSFKSENEVKNLLG